MRTLFLLLCLPMACLGQAFSFRDLPFMAPRGSVPLSFGLQAVWHFDEVPTVSGGKLGADRLDAGPNALTLTDVNHNMGALRGFNGGGVISSNTANTYYLKHAYTSKLAGGAGKSFTMACWVVSGNGNVAHIGCIDPANETAYDFDLQAGGFTAKQNDGITKTIGWAWGSAQVQATNFTLVVVGYDFAAQQLFVSTNGAAKITSAMTDVRDSTQPFCVDYLLGVVDELTFWDRALTAAEITFLYNNGSGQTYPYANAPANQLGVNVTSAYDFDRILAGGLHLSSGTSNALVTFVNGCATDGIWSRFLVAYPFPENGVIGAMVPLVSAKYRVTGGNDSMVYQYEGLNNGFVDADLTINGLAGNASSKYIDTGFDASTEFASYDSSGLSAYAYTATGNSAYRDLGSYIITGNRGFILTFNTTGATAGASATYLGGDADTAGVSPSPGTGFYTASRTGNTTCNLYFANSGTAFASIASSAVARAEVFPSGNANLFSINIPGFSANFGPTDNRMSFVDFHTGLTLGQSQSLYNRVQAYLVSKGGGFR